MKVRESDSISTYRQPAERAQHILAGVILIIISLGLLWSAGEPAAALGAGTAAPFVSDLRDILIHVQPDGSVIVRETIRIESDSAGTVSEFILPFYQEAELEVRSVQVGSLNGSGDDIDYLDIPAMADAPQNAVVYYQAFSDTDAHTLKLRMMNSFAANEKRIARIRYRLENAVSRYQDVSDLHLIFAELGRTAADELSVVISFSGGSLPEEDGEELRRIYLFTDHDDSSAGSFVSRPISSPEEALTLPTGSLAYDYSNSPNYRLVISDVGNVSETGLRIVFPSAWVPDLPLDTEQEQSMLGRILQEEGMERDLDRRQTEIRRNIMGFYPYLLLASAAAFLILVYQRIVRPFLRNRTSETGPPGDLLPAEIQYLLRRSVGGRTIQCTMKDLVAKGYLDYRERHFVRVPEVSLPDENDLALFERHLLHWVWEMMAGREALSAGAFREEATRVTSRVRFASQYRRFARLLHERMLTGELVASQPLLNVHIPTFVIGLLNIVLGLFFVVLSWSLAGGMLLLLFGFGYILWAFRFRSLTAKGKVMRIRAQTYKHYLANFGEEIKNSERILDEFERHFPYAVAVGREPEFIYSLAERVPFEQLIASSFMKRFGTSRLEKILLKLHAREGELSKERIRKVFRYVAREIEKDGNAFIASVLHVKLNTYRE